MSSNKRKAPKEVEGVLSMEEGGSYCTITIACDQSEELTAQDILDATSDCILHFFNVDKSAWNDIKIGRDSH